MRFTFYGDKNNLYERKEIKIPVPKTIILETPFKWDPTKCYITERDISKEKQLNIYLPMYRYPEVSENLRCLQIQWARRMCGFQLCWRLLFLVQMWLETRKRWKNIQMLLTTRELFRFNYPMLVVEKLQAEYKTSLSQLSYIRWIF